MRTLFKRLFVAVNPPDYVRDALGELKQEARGIQWIPPERHHLTLKFIGEIDPDAEERICRAFDKIDSGSFILPLGRVGVFPESGPPQVIWAGVGGGHPRLYKLQHTVQDTLFNLGYDPGKRAFQPHITLARCHGASGEWVRQWLKKHRDFEGPAFRVDHFGLWRSRTGMSDVPYLQEAAWSLKSDVPALFRPAVHHVKSDENHSQAVGE